MGVLKQGLRCDFDRLREIADRHANVQAFLGHDVWFDPCCYYFCISAMIFRSRRRPWPRSATERCIATNTRGSTMLPRKPAPPLFVDASLLYPFYSLSVRILMRGPSRSHGAGRQGAAIIPAASLVSIRSAQIRSNRPDFSAHGTTGRLARTGSASACRCVSCAERQKPCSRLRCESASNHAPFQAFKSGPQRGVVFRGGQKPEGAFGRL